MEPEEIKKESEWLKVKHKVRRREASQYLNDAKPKAIQELEINEKVEETEYILHCPKCKKDSSHFQWEIKKNTAVCPHCKTENPRERVLIIQEIKTELTRLK
jgi:acetyl-CoA carboxylase beta subunit